jgi:hypothetical protein
MGLYLVRGLRALLGDGDCDQFSLRSKRDSDMDPLFNIQDAKDLMKAAAVVGLAAVALGLILGLG